MAGRFTRSMYDSCAFQQDVHQSTQPLELMMDVNKYVNCSNICKPARQYPPAGISLVDVESSLWGLDKILSRCDQSKYPLCGPNGCLVNGDPRIPRHMTPFACSWGHDSDRNPGVITTNMRMPTNAGYQLPDTQICNRPAFNGYYADLFNFYTRPNMPLHPATQMAPMRR